MLVSALTVSTFAVIKPEEDTLPRLALMVMSPAPTLIRLAFVRLPLFSVRVTLPLFVVMSSAATDRSPIFCSNVNDSLEPEMVAAMLAIVVMTFESVPASTVS